MVAPDRKRKGVGVGEAGTSRSIHSTNSGTTTICPAPSAWQQNRSRCAHSIAPATPAGNYCLAGALRTAAHGRTDGRRTEGSTCRRPLKTGQTTPLRSPDLEAWVLRRKSRLAPPSRSSGVRAPAPPAPRRRWATWPPRSARFTAAQPGRVASGLSGSPGAF